MAQRVGRGRLGQAGRLDRPLHCPLQQLFIHVMSPLATVTRIDGIAARTEHVLPAPFRRSVWIFPGQSIGKPDLRLACDAVIPIDQAAFFEVSGKRPRQNFGQHRHPVLGALAVADHDLSKAEIQVLDPQPYAFHQAHSGAVKQTGHQGVRALHAFEDDGNLGRRENGRQALRLLRPSHVVQPGQIDAEHLAVEKQQRRKRLILGCRRDATRDRQIGQEGLHLRPSHLARMLLAMEKNEPSNPLDIGSLSAYAVVFEPDQVANLVEKPGRRQGKRGI